MMKGETSLSEGTQLSSTEGQGRESGKKEITLQAQPQSTLFAALAEQSVVLEAGCNGKGRCGRCRVKYLSAAPLPTATERRFFTPQELRAGIRLACLHPVKGACRVEPIYVQPAAVQIVTEMPGNGNACAAAMQHSENDWCIAIDLGTTTIAMQARRLADGAVLGVWKGMNPQRRFGSDVISRMQAANEGCAAKLKDSVETVLTAGIKMLLKTVQDSLRTQDTSKAPVALKTQDTPKAQDTPKTPDGTMPAVGWKGIYLAGNTVMEHLLAGLSVEGLSRHPFSPVTLEEQRLMLSLQPVGQEEKQPLPDTKNEDGQHIWGETAEVTLLPGFSAFVGADLLAGVIACGMHRKAEISLLIDLGTNGEIVLGNREKLLCTATAAGPAFEGGPGNPAPGTDMIAVIAELMEAGIVDETGLMAEPWFEKGIDWETGGCSALTKKLKLAAAQQEATGAAVHMTQEQIRAVQMAKAAIYAGICILVKEYGITFEDIKKVYLAGGFGYYLDVEKAARIGLFPDELKGKVTAVGNTSLKGAFLYGRNADKEAAAQMKKRCRAINLAEHADFETIYLEHLNLE